MYAKEYEEIMPIADDLKEWCDEKYEEEVPKYWWRVINKRAKMEGYFAKRHSKKRYNKYGQKNNGFNRNTRGNNRQAKSRKFSRN